MNAIYRHLFGSKENQPKPSKHYLLCIAEIFFEAQLFFFLHYALSLVLCFMENLCFFALISSLSLSHFGSYYC